MRELPPLPKKVKGNICDCVVLIAPMEDAYAHFEPVGSYTGQPEIVINSKIQRNPELVWESFFHELVHFWEFDGGFALPEEPMVAGHSVVELVALAFWGTWKRNKWPLPGE